MANLVFDPIVELLGSASSEADVRKVCDRFCEQVTFEYFIFAVCDVTSLSSPEIHSITNYSAEWFNDYFEQGAQKVDPVVRYCFENTAPVRWDRLVLMEEYMDPNGVALMQRASESGLVNGLSIPIKAPSGEIAIFSLATGKSQDIERRLNQVLPVAHTFCVQLFDAYMRIRAERQTVKESALTSRERECLFWACEGKTTWEMARILEISERTVIFHLTSATKKLGAANRQHAVAKAILKGLVKPQP